MNPQQLSQFMQTKEFNDMVDMAMLEEGVYGNLGGMDYLRAKQAYINGMFDGVVYTEKNNIQRDPAVPGWSDVDQSRRGWAGLQLQAQSQAMQAAKFQREMEEDDIRRELLYERDPKTGKLKYRDGAAPPGWVRDPVTGRLVRDYNKTGKSGSGSDNNDGTTRRPQLQEKIRLQWKGDTPNDTNGDEDDRMDPPQILPKDLEEYAGQATPYEKLPAYVQKKVADLIGEENAGDPSLYTIYYKPYQRGGLWGALNDTETVVDIVPTNIAITNASQILDTLNGGLYGEADFTNMLPKQ